MVQTRSRARLQAGVVDCPQCEAKVEAEKKVTSPARLIPRLVSFAEAPQWLQDNHYLTHGYRLDHGFFSSLKSICTLHNESLNIWTHLVGFLIFMFLTYYTFTYRLPGHIDSVFKEAIDSIPTLHLATQMEEMADKLHFEILSKLPDMPDLPNLELASPKFWTSLLEFSHHVEKQVDASILAVFPFLDNGNHTLSIAPMFGRLWALHRDAPMHQFMFGFFFTGAMCCTFFSFLFHTFMCTSPQWCTVLCRLDYASISIMIAASACPAVFYGHYCHPWWQYFWLVLICFCCFLGVCVSMMERFSANEWRAFRAATFVAVGFSGVLPITHQAIRENGLFTDATATLTLKLIIMAALYVLGAFLFATRIPERFFPGKCNIWFHSHQLHHVCVVVAAYMHWTGLLSGFEYRMANPCALV